MAEEDAERQPVSSVNRPGTSCLGCRRRKLKCTRETEGCQNCTKADLPCVYPTPEVGVKRKRGPYKKDKPARQRHLEDLVRYLEPRNSNAEQDFHNDRGSSGQSASPANVGQTPPAPNERLSSRPPLQTANSEDLVKDALIALTKSSVSERESRRDEGTFLSPSYAGQQGSGSGAHHPPIRRIFEYWQIYLTRCDPMTKVVHTPSFGRKLVSILDNLGGVPPSTEAMLFSIYYASVSTCTARECRERFGESQQVLLSRYGRNIEAAMGDNYEMPTLECLLALVLYLICIRRQHEGTNVRALFQLALRTAQMIGAHEDPEGKYSPLESEIRRRVWCHLQGLENSTAEEGQSRGKSVMANSNVKLPSNLNDCDLDSEMTQAPQPRSGTTDMTFPTLRFEIHRLVFELLAIKMRHSSGWNQGLSLRDMQSEYLETTRSRLQEQFICHLDPSRPYDWMCLKFVNAMLIKAQLIVDFPYGAVPTKTMPADERMRLLKASVDIISFTHVLAWDPRIKDWLWYFRGYVQWQSLAIVVAELSWNSNPEFADVAWQVLDPILADWDRMYQMKRDEPHWNHVNGMIERARILRRQRTRHPSGPKKKQVRANKSSSNNNNVANTAAQNAQPFPPPTFEEPDTSAAQGLAALATTETPSFHETSTSYLPQSSATASTTQEPGGFYSQTTPMINFGIDFSEQDAMTSGFDSVDFNAFDLVFGSVSWETGGLMDDVNAQLEEVERFVGAQEQIEMGRG